MHLENLKALANYDMPSEFVLDMQLDGEADFGKVAHVPSVQFWYIDDGIRVLLF